MIIPKNRYKNILITGGCGFIGSNLVRRILKNYNSTIYNLDKLTYASNIKSINTFINQNNIKKEKHILLKEDLSIQSGTIQAVKESNPDLIFHLAAESHVDKSITKPSDFITSNIIGTYNLLTASRSHYESLNEERKKIFKFIHVSTDEVFGSLEGNHKFSEETKYDPRSPYSASKASSDHLVKAWGYTFNLPVIITNCSNNYGPWQYPEKLIPVIIFNAIKDLSIPIYGNGENIRDWIHVEDHIDALLTVAESGKVGESYCIGANSQISNIEMAKLICKIIDRELKRTTDSRNLIKLVKDRLGHDKKYAINSSKIEKDLGWKAQIKFNQGIEDTVKWYLKKNTIIN